MVPNHNAFIDYSNGIDDIYKNIDEHTLNINFKVADMLKNKKNYPIVTELFIKDRNIFSCFYCTILFSCTKKYWTKFHSLLYHEYSKRKRPSTNCN